MFKRKLLFTTLLASLLIGCNSGSNKNEKVTITIWEDETNIAVLETLLEEFSSDYVSKYPSAQKIDFKIIPHTEGSAISDMQLDGPSGNGADIFAFVHNTLGTAVQWNLIAENPFAETLALHHSDEAIQAFSNNKVMYGYPINSESLTVMYDKSKVDIETLSSMENLKVANKKIAWDVTTKSGAYYTFGLMNDANLFGSSGQDATSLNLATTNTINNYYSLVKDYKNNIANADPDTGLSLLTRGDVVGFISSPYLWSSLKQNIGNNAAITVLPSINEQAQRPFSGYKGYGVSTFSKQPALSHMFANFLISEDAQYYRYRQLGYLPTINDSSRINESVEGNEISLVYKTSLSNSITMPNIAKMGDFWAPMQDAVSQIWNLSSPTTEAITTILTTATNEIK